MIHDYIVMFENLFAERGLSLERLKTLCEVAEARGVTRAAKDPVRQSQFSRQIRELETYLGAELFLRKRNSFRLTAAGEKLVLVAKEFMKSLELARSEIKNMPQSVCIGAGEAVYNWLLFPRLSKVQELFPNFRLEFRNLRSRDIVRGILESELDLGVVREDACAKELKRAGLGKISFCLFVPAKLKTRVKGKKEAELLSGLPLATLEGDGQYKTKLVEAAKREGIDLDFRIVCSSFPLMAEALKQGQAGAILPNIAEVVLPEPQFQRVHLEMLKGMDRRYVLCYRQRMLDRREVLSKRLGDLVELLQVPSAC